MACCDGTWNERTEGSHRMDSFIRAADAQSLGMRRLVVSPRVFVETPAMLDLRQYDHRGATPIRCHPERSSASTIFSELKHSIESAWNDQLCVVPGRPRREEPIALSDCLMCSVDLRNATSRGEADLVVVVAVEPEGNVICSTRMGGRQVSDMILRFPEVWDRREARPTSFDRYQRSDSRGVTVDQNTAAHEFGHYLGIEHGCQRAVVDAALEREDRFGLRSPSEQAVIAGEAMNSDEAYCTGPFASSGAPPARQQTALMNTGRRLVASYGMAWAIRVPIHHRCTQAWSPRTVSEQVMAQ